MHCACNVLPSVLSVEHSSLLCHCFWGLFGHDYLLGGNALLRGESGGDGGDDGGAVAAAVGGGQGQEGGGEDEGLHGGGLSEAAECERIYVGEALSQNPQKSHV